MDLLTSGCRRTGLTNSVVTHVLGSVRSLSSSSIERPLSNPFPKKEFSANVLTYIPTMTIQVEVVPYLS